MRNLLFTSCMIVLVVGSGWFGCGKAQPLSSGVKQIPVARLVKPAAKAALMHRAVVVATVIQSDEPASDVEVAFSRSTAGRPTDYRWKGTTDENGEVEIEITVDPTGQFWQIGTTGYYLAKAIDPATEEVLGTWGSIPLNDGKTTELILEVGKRVQFIQDLRSRFNLQTLGPIPYPLNNPYDPQRVALGKLVFFDPILGGEKDVACATCHLPKLAFADDRQFGAGTSGVGVGKDRMVSNSSITGDKIELEPRNTPTVFNTAFNADERGRPSPLGFQFLDGRIKGLEEQATKPITSRVEMRGDAYSAEAALDSVIARLRAIPEYVRLFQEAFPEEAAQTQGGVAVIDSSTYGRAIAAYERELVTRNSSYDRYVDGDDNALSDVQKLGLELFFTKAKCVACHSGPMFSDFRFIVQGVPQEGTGKGVIPGDDTGREEHTKNPADRYAFRTLTLRNVELTAPYMHDGVFKTLEGVVRFYNDGARPRHPAVTDDMMDPVLVESLGLTDEEINAIVEFMKALTDPGTALDPFLLTVPDEVPSGLTPLFGVRAVGEIVLGPEK